MKKTVLTRQLIILSTLAAAASMAACSDDAGSKTTVCQTGATQICACTDGSQGSQVCISGDEGWGECTCSATPSSNACDNVSCGEHGICVFAKDGAGCLCRDGYISALTDTKAPTCKEPQANPGTPADTDVCQNINCSEHGACVATSKGAGCLCDTGYVSAFDDTTPVCNPNTPNADPCKDIDCTDHGVCVAQNNTPNCFCSGNYEAGLDENNNVTCVPKTNVCDGITCDGKGSCIDMSGTANCICNDTDKYQSGTDNDGNPTCVEKGTVSDGPCKDVSCSDQGSCLVAKDEAVCVCNKGYAVDPADKTKCVEASESPCKDIDCTDKGACIVANDAPTCMCADGYQPGADDDGNPTCKEKAVIDLCEGITCDDHGRCLTASDAAICICDDGYQSTLDGQTPTCKEKTDEPSPCEGIDCANNGICMVSGDNKAVCMCNSGYHQDTTSGTPTCIQNEEVDSPCKDVTCADHGTCLITAGNKPFCVCSTGYHQDTTGETPTCIQDAVTEDGCKDVTCSDHGSCIVTSGNQPFCVCAAGYHQGATNTSCDKDSDVTNPCTGQKCSEHGLCLVTGDNTAYCLCNEGYVNDGAVACKPKTDTPASACKDVTCSGHGTCLVAADNTAYCACDYGYYNDSKTTCKQTTTLESPCKSVTCSGHGTCLVTGDNTAYCLCNAGYKQNGTTQCVEDAATTNPCKGITCSNHGVCLVTGTNTAYCLCDENYKNDGADKCVSDGGISHGQAYPTEAVDPWGLVWDSQERPAQTHMNAAATCASIGGRLPTPTEIIRNNHNSGYKGIGDVSNTNALWTDAMGISNGDYIESIPLHNGAIGQTHRTTPIPFRCVWPKDRPALLTGENCYSTPADLSAGKSCKTVEIGKIKYTMDSATRPAQFYFQAVEECYKQGGRLPTYIELIQLMTHGAYTTNEDWSWTEFVNSYYGVVNWNNSTKAYSISQSGWNTARTFRCISEQVKTDAGKPVFPQTKANNLTKVIEITPQLRIDATPRTKDSTWNAIYDCMNDGGRLASFDEMNVAIHTGKLPVPTTQILTSSAWNNSSLYINQWNAFIAPYYMPSAGATALTTTFPYYCTYRPARDFDFTSLNTRVSEGKAAKYSDNDENVYYYVHKKTDLTSGAVVTVSDAYAENEGTYLPTYAELLFAIRKGMTTIYTTDTLITSTPYDGNYNVRTINWSGAGNPSTTPGLGAVSYQTSTSTSRSFLSTTIR